MVHGDVSSTWPPSSARVLPEGTSEARENSRTSEFSRRDQTWVRYRVALPRLRPPPIRVQFVTKFCSLRCSFVRVDANHSRQLEIKISNVIFSFIKIALAEKIQQGRNAYRVFNSIINFPFWTSVLNKCIHFSVFIVSPADFSLSSTACIQLLWSPFPSNFTPSL